MPALKKNQPGAIKNNCDCFGGCVLLQDNWGSLSEGADISPNFTVVSGSAGITSGHELSCTSVGYVRANPIYPGCSTSQRVTFYVRAGMPGDVAYCRVNGYDDNNYCRVEIRWSNPPPYAGPSSAAMDGCLSLYKAVDGVETCVECAQLAVHSSYEDDTSVTIFCANGYLWASVIPGTGGATTLWYHVGDTNGKQVGIGVRELGTGSAVIFHSFTIARLAKPDETGTGCYSFPDLSCSFAGDNFFREVTTTDPGCSWTGDSFYISNPTGSEYVLTTTESNAMTFSRTQHPDGLPEVNVGTVIDLSAPYSEDMYGVELRIFAGYADDTYYFAQVKINDDTTGHLKLSYFNQLTSTETVIDECDFLAIGGSSCTFNLCMSEGIVAGLFLNMTTTNPDQYGAVVSGLGYQAGTCGLAVGNVPDGQSAQFTNWSFNLAHSGYFTGMESGCPSCFECGACGPTETGQWHNPLEYQVTFTGVVGGTDGFGNTCDDASAMNAAFGMKWAGFFQTHGGLFFNETRCARALTTALTVCGYSLSMICGQFDTGFQLYLIFAMPPELGGGYAGQALFGDTSSLPDCWAERTLTLLYWDGPIDFSGATVTVQGLLE